MSNEQVKNKIDEVQASVSDALTSLRKILQRTRELDTLENKLRESSQVDAADSVAAVKNGLMEDIDAHIDSLSTLIREYQEFVSDTI
jgi:hypothetical protein